MNNKNDLLRREKEEGIRAAIRHLDGKGILNISNKMISNTTRDLFPNDLNKQIAVNTLSKKEYYKSNLQKWIEEETGLKLKKMEEVRKKALEVRKKLVMQNYKKIEQSVDEIVDSIIKGNLKCEKMSKAFLTDLLIKKKEQKGLKISKATLSLETYNSIYERAVKRLNTSSLLTNANDSEEVVSVKELAHLREENKRLKKVNKNLISGLFHINNEEINDAFFIVGDGNTLTQTTIDKDLLYSYLNLFKKKLPKDINAYSFMKEIVEYCKK
ncbi:MULTISPECIES: hypothetical protein [Bacillus]|uniref:Uncharacterized protein n=1 Tax=Bacillus pseudomycoides TaxID=64104 RepID=A0A1Y3M7A6_9BACI|nr:hypothetical protein [Bacillus pseudomycoides]OUM46307.1 hypothetical protein BW425_24505 [Bacillus pseudomycoides]